MKDQFQPDDSPARKRYEQDSIVDYKKNAAESLQKNILETSKGPHDWIKYGLLLQEISKKYNEAENAYRRAIEFNPKNHWAWMQLIKLQINQFINIFRVFRGQSSTPRSHRRSTASIPNGYQSNHK